MNKIWKVVGAAVIGLSFSLAAVGCKPSTKTDKMEGGKQDKMASDMMKGGKMETDKMATDKMNGDKMEIDKMKGDKMEKK